MSTIMPNTDTGIRLVQNMVLAGLATAATAYASTKVTKIPSLNMNAALAAAVLSGTGATVGQGVHTYFDDKGGFLGKIAAVAVFVLAFNAATQAKPLTDKVSFLNVGGTAQFLTVSGASVAGIIGGTALIGAMKSKTTPYAGDVDSLKKFATDAADAAAKKVAADEALAKIDKDAATKEDIEKAEKAVADAQKDLDTVRQGYQDILAKHTFEKDDLKAAIEALNKDPELCPKKV